MRKFIEATKLYNLTPIEVAIRWITYHSALGDEVGVIIGASKAEQVGETVDIIGKGLMLEGVLKTADDLWNAVKESRHSII